MHACGGCWPATKNSLCLLPLAAFVDVVESPGEPEVVNFPPSKDVCELVDAELLLVTDRMSRDTFGFIFVAAVASYSSFIIFFKDSFLMVKFLFCVTSVDGLDFEEYIERFLEHVFFGVTTILFLGSLM